MPYTTLYVSALGMGLTVSDLRSMPLNELLWLVHQRNELSTGKGGGKGRAAASDAAAMKRFVS